MFHQRRAHTITPHDDLGALARDVIETSHVLCFGARCGELLVLNDSLTEEDHLKREYAVVLDGRQIESITIDAMSADRFRASLERLLSDPTARVDLGPVEVREHARSVYCVHCA